MLYAEDTPANHSPSPGNDAELPTHDTSGLTCETPLAFYDRDTHSWRMSQGTFDLGLETSSPTWPASGTMQNGTAYPRLPSAPRIYVTDCSLWPTPTVTDLGANRTIPEWDEWTTVMKASHDTGNGHGKSLSIEARRWPTPTTKDRPNAPNRLGGPTLAAEVNRWPTPTARLGEQRGPQAKRYSDPARSSDLDDAVAATGIIGQLNPQWVEWLMGFPPDWTDLRR